MGMVFPHGYQYLVGTLDRSAGGAGVPVLTTWYEVVSVDGPGVLLLVLLIVLLVFLLVVRS